MDPPRRYRTTTSRRDAAAPPASRRTTSTPAPVLVRRLLRRWHAEVGDGDPDAALGLALRRGGTGRDRRARVVRDLTRLANADGRFLDREEDPLGRLVDAWGVVL